MVRIDTTDNDFTALENLVDTWIQEVNPSGIELKDLALLIPKGVKVSYDERYGDVQRGPDIVKY